MGHSTSSGAGGGGRERLPSTIPQETRESLRRAVTDNEDLTAAVSLRQYRNRMRDDANKLDDLYSKRRDTETPEQTVGKFVRAVGEERAANTIATLINANADDGRIGRANREWARGVSGALSAEENRYGVSTRMHMAHLDQVADEMRKRQRR